MHRYGIAKKISSMFEGIYVPSPGVIYPTLQWLEDQGYVKSSRLYDSTSYSISDSGKKYLKQNEENLSEIISFIKNRIEMSDYPILQSAARLQRTIASSLGTMSNETNQKVARIVDDANEKGSRLV